MENKKKRRGFSSGRKRKDKFSSTLQEKVGWEKKKNTFVRCHHEETEGGVEKGLMKKSQPAGGIGTGQN